MQSSIQRVFDPRIRRARFVMVSKMTRVYGKTIENLRSGNRSLHVQRHSKFV
ncbi:hypothetical protein Pla52o_56620 [Novipirellula galeiformis]|uniref:Uncharacterized protein n=1 Tax=Novipirellula galeiformis TaxID=2528004 RepID=A0A5C6BEP4_9BACT|nr:hypothetical protein Pla52o_56620 [Novipirellula galeiformis]